MKATMRGFLDGALVGLWVVVFVVGVICAMSLASWLLFKAFA